jgi:selenocysteine-specific elongation factor
MTKPQTNITLGTAGHIDHGKTALVKCLTGCDTDRLKIEKERGMSIELGFAPCMINGLEVGIVDVPGHEKFIKTMVAGATGIDGVIFVVAADDGIMPQTREHLDILTLLNVKHGIIALTKTDCVNQERLDTVSVQIKNFTVGTFLENSMIVPVSNITGKGFDILLEQLENLVSKIKPKSIDGVFRMPVERTFTVKGYGTVVTGIAVCGSAKIGDELILFPQGVKGKIKAIQVYKHNSDTVMSGQCAAVNVPQWDYNSIKRGNVITRENYFLPRQWYLCNLQLLQGKDLSLKNGTNVKFHTGTSEIIADVYLLESNNLAAGCNGLVQLRLDEPVVAGPRDRFILRSLSPVKTIGGGMIVESISDKLRRTEPDVVKTAQKCAQAIINDNDFVEYCIRAAKNNGTNESELSFRTKILPKPLESIIAELTKQDKIVNLVPKLYLHRESEGEAEAQIVEIVAKFHRDNPQSPGITPKELFETSHLKKEVFDGILKMLISRNNLIEKKERIALPQHCETFSDEETKLLKKVEELFITRLFNPPQSAEILEYTCATPEKVHRIMRILTEQKNIIEVEKELFFHAQAIEKARQTLISFITKEGKLESVRFKYLLDTTRKFALPLLDYFDHIGVTRRLENTRYLKHD